MRKISTGEFLKLHSGVLFASAYDSSICIKGKTLYQNNSQGFLYGDVFYMTGENKEMDYWPIDLDHENHSDFMLFEENDIVNIKKIIDLCLWVERL